MIATREEEIDDRKLADGQIAEKSILVAAAATAAAATSATAAGVAERENDGREEKRKRAGRPWKRGSIDYARSGKAN